jgi:aspartate kinase
MKIIVQKFGGTSLINQERRNQSIDKIKAALDKKLSPVVVVSAIGRIGDPYATDTLINFVKSIGVEPSPRELDILMSCGEIISAVTLSNTLKARGYNSAVFSGGQAGIITNDKFLNAKILRVEPKNILNALEKGVIPIIAGFQGVTEQGDITTLGRGGSDVTASIMGEALDAEMVEIYTDVDGIMTADPRIVSDAQMMDSILYDEMFQMAEYGSKVIHPRAVEIAMRCNMPLVIRNTTSEVNGTLITNDYKALTYRKSDENRIITSVTQIENKAQVNIDLSKLQHENNEVLFDCIAKAGISIDMINIYPQKIYFIVDENQTNILENVLKELNYGGYKLIHNCSKVTIIGSKMRGIPGVMARMVSALSNEDIEILQTSDSHTTISCLISSEHTNKAIIALHNYFELGK